MPSLYKVINYLAEEYVLGSLWTYMLDEPGPPVNHKVNGSFFGSFCDSKYQKKRWLDPTSSHPVYCFEWASQRLDFWEVILIE